MDEEKQISIIQDLLKIPVKQLTFNNNYVEILSANECVGNIPYRKAPGNIIYDIPKEVVNRLNWANIYINNRDLIDPMIYNLLNRNDIHFTIGNFRRLYVYDDTNILICSIECRYDNNNWNIIRE